MIHKSTIEKYNGSIDELVEDIGNLRYDVLSQFLQKLSSKLESDSKADFQRKRFKLSNALNDASSNIETASLDIEEAWIISEPFMKSNG
jgi:hypothetical protein